MKKLRLLMPLAVACTAITPIATITSCGDNSSVEVITKSVDAVDSLTSYKFKLPKVPADKKVTVNVINKSESQEQVYLYEPYSTSNGILSTIECDVAADGTVEVPAGYYLAPSQSASSEFGLSFTYKDGETTTTKTVDGLKFNYTIDYGAELKDGNYPAQDAQPATYWTGKNVGETYGKDVLANPLIFQNDARYSTSVNIKNAITNNKLYDIDSFKAYFNDIVKEDDGLHVHMNYQVKGKTTSAYEFQISQTTKFKFSNFNFSFTFETPNGYKFSTTEPTTNADAKTLYVVDPEKEYLLTGRFEGTFTCGVNDETPKTITYNGLIDNYTIFSNTNTTYDDDELASMLAFGIIVLTYDFGFGTGDIPILKLLSPYAKNA